MEARSSFPELADKKSPVLAIVLACPTSTALSKVLRCCCGASYHLRFIRTSLTNQLTTYILIRCQTLKSVKNYQTKIGHSRCV